MMKRGVRWEAACRGSTHECGQTGGPMMIEPPLPAFMKAPFNVCSNVGGVRSYSSHIVSSSARASFLQPAGSGKKQVPAIARPE